MSSAMTKALERNRALVASAHAGAMELKAASKGSLFTPSNSGLSQIAAWSSQQADREKYAAFKGWLYAAIHALASKASTQPVKVGRMKGVSAKPGKQKHLRMSERMQAKAANGELEVLENHQMVDILAKPNGMQGQGQFTYSFVANLCLTGWGYICRDGDDYYSLPTTWITPFHEGQPFSRIEVKNPGDAASKPIPFEKGEFGFAHFPNPANPLAAVSPASTQMPAIRIDDHIQASQERFFENGIFPSAIVTIGKDPHPEVPAGIRPRLTAGQRRQVHAAISKVMAGVANYGNPAIIDGMIESIERWQATANEMGWQQSEQTIKARILAAFGVHQYILGESVNVGGYAQVFNIEKRFFDRVNIFLGMLSELMTNFATPGKDKSKLLVWWEQCEAVDPQVYWQNMNQARGRGDVSQSEFRAAMGLPPDEDGQNAQIDTAQMQVVVQLMTAAGAGQISPAQAQAAFVGMGIAEDLAEELAGDGPQQQLIEATDALGQATDTLRKPVKEEVDEAEKEIKKMMLGWDAKAFCPTGPGGGVDNSCGRNAGRAGASAQVREILDQAEKVKFSDAPASSGAGRRDYDLIEEAMTPEERDDLQMAMDEARNEYVSEYGDDIDFESASYKDGAVEAGHTDDAIKDVSLTIVAGNEKMEEAVNSWYNNTRKVGGEAINELMGKLQDIEGWNDELESQFNQYHADVEDQIESAIQELNDSAQESAREDLANGFDEDEAREAYLRDFYDNNEKRFSGEVEKDTWQETFSGQQYSFETKDGRRFDINTNPAYVRGIMAKDIQFSDEEGNFSITGKGSAFEVFSKVVPAITALVQKNDDSVVHFSASGDSRQRLYDRLTKTMLSVFPDRFAQTYDVAGTRHYIIAKSEMRAKIEQAMKSVKGGTVKIPSGSRGTPVGAECDPAWWTEDAWDDIEEPAKQKRQYGCVMASFPLHVISKMKAMGKQIDLLDLHEDGVETDPHVTIKFGLHTTDATEVRALFDGKNPIRIKFGKVSLFENEKQDVVKIDVESDDLHALNKLISDKLECTDTHPEYKPHATIAYVQPGAGKKYLDMANDLEGTTAVLHKIVFSDKSKNKTSIRLQQRKGFCPTGPGGGIDNSCGRGGGQWSDIKPLPHDKWQDLPADPDYFYHATNVDNAQDVSGSSLIPHGPSYGTDQEEWPDGNEDDRSYFTHSPKIAYQFAPEDGKPALLRVSREAAKFGRESTGDMFTTDTIDPQHIEIATENGWVRLSDLKATNK